MLGMLSIGEGAYEDLRRHGQEAYPLEACGVLLGRVEGAGGVVTAIARCANSAATPAHRWRIDPGELLAAHRRGRARGEDVVGLYHSHPDQPAHWSPADLEEAHGLGLAYVIVEVVGGSAGATRAFVLEGAEGARRFRHEEIRVIPSG
jgi:proteasome lid subunit RPN8/RPN11